MEYMPEVADKAFSLAVPDPPYFSGPEKRGFYGRSVSPIGIKRLYAKTEEWQLPNTDFWNECQRISKNQIIWGANYFDFIGPVHKTPRGELELKEWIAAHPVGWIVWDKLNGASSFNDYELAWTSFDRPTTIFKFMWNGMLQGKSVSQGHIMQGNKRLNERRIHPTQKPRALYKWTYASYCNAGDTVFDPYVGSGSSRIEAFEAGLPFIGTEKTNIHFDAQEKRFKEYKAQGVLF